VCVSVCVCVLRGVIPSDEVETRSVGLSQLHPDVLQHDEDEDDECNYLPGFA